MGFLGARERAKLRGPRGFERLRYDEDFPQSTSPRSRGPQGPLSQPATNAGAPPIIHHLRRPTAYWNSPPFFFLSPPISKCLQRLMGCILTVLHFCGARRRKGEPVSEPRPPSPQYETTSLDLSPARGRTDGTDGTAPRRRRETPKRNPRLPLLHASLPLPARQTNSRAPSSLSLFL